VARGNAERAAGLDWGSALNQINRLDFARIGRAGILVTTTRLFSTITEVRSRNRWQVRRIHWYRQRLRRA
jgi:hypothetical protein